MNGKLRPAVGIIFLALGCIPLRAQTTYNGQIQPGVSTRSDTERALGAPIKEEKAGVGSVFDYKPGAGARLLQIFYRADGVVNSIRVEFTEPYSRDAMILALGLPDNSQGTRTAQGVIAEYFGAPAFLVFGHVSTDMNSKVSILVYCSAEEFQKLAPGPGQPNPQNPVVTQTTPPPSRRRTKEPTAPPDQVAESTGPQMWQKQLGANNQDWTVCAGMAANALSSQGYTVTAVKDGQGRQRLFYGTGNGSNSAMISCSWAGTTAVTLVTSSSTSGTSDAQNVVNRLVAGIASPTPGNNVVLLRQMPASVSIGLWQRQQTVFNQPWSACTSKVEQALASLGYTVTNTIDGQGFESNFYGTGNGPNAAAIGCASVGTITIYTITSSSTLGTSDAASVANRLYNILFPSGTAN